METRKSTTAGVLFWTPAPAHTSPSSSVISEDLWEDEDDEQAGKDADFVSQMDENGIIGLSEALEHVELVEDAEYDPNFYPGRRTTEEPDLCRHEVGTPHEELSYNLSEHLSHSESPGEDGQILSPCESIIMYNVCMYYLTLTQVFLSNNIVVAILILLTYHTP